MCLAAQRRRGPDHIPALSARRRDMIIVNALGGLSNPNGAQDPDEKVRNLILHPRVIQDARRSGMTVVNQTIGYVSGPKDPFEESIRDIGFWQARFRAHPRDWFRSFPGTISFEPIAKERSA